MSEINKTVWVVSTERIIMSDRADLPIGVFNTREAAEKFVEDREVYGAKLSEWPLNPRSNWRRFNVGLFEDGKVKSVEEVLFGRDDIGTPVSIHALLPSQGGKVVWFMLSAVDEIDAVNFALKHLKTWLLTDEGVLWLKRRRKVTEMVEWK